MSMTFVFLYKFPLLHNKRKKRFLKNCDKRERQKTKKENSRDRGK